MDMIRLALERCRTAREALDHICYYVEAIGQDACGGYMNRKFFYHNSFIIADPEESFVLETAGRHWVYRKVRGFYAISNRLTIGREWDGISASAISFARQRKWSKQHMDFDFADAYTAPVMSWLAKAKERRHTCETTAARLSEGRKMTVADAIGMLRTHRHGETYLPQKGGMDSVCLHANGLLTPSQTTGSMVAELKYGNAEPVWATGSSAPCLSLFKPFFMDAPLVDENFIKAPGAIANDTYWWQWEAWHREALQNYPAAKSIWADKALPLEQQWLRDQDDRAGTGAAMTARGQRSRDAVDASLRVLQEMRETLRLSGRKKTGWRYRHYWNGWNRKAGIPPSFR
jgi:dipeptidase